MVALERLAFVMQGTMEREGLQKLARAMAIACKEQARFIRHSTGDHDHPTAGSWDDASTRFVGIALACKLDGIESGLSVRDASGAHAPFSLRAF